MMKTRKTQLSVEIIITTDHFNNLQFCLLTKQLPRLPLPGKLRSRLCTHRQHGVRRSAIAVAAEKPEIQHLSSSPAPTSPVVSCDISEEVKQCSSAASPCSTPSPGPSHVQCPEMFSTLLRFLSWSTPYFPLQARHTHHVHRHHRIPPSHQRQDHRLQGGRGLGRQAAARRDGHPGIVLCSMGMILNFCSLCFYLCLGCPAQRRGGAGEGDQQRVVPHRHLHAGRP